MENIFIFGDSNIIDSGCSSIFVVGDSITISSGITEVDVFGSNIVIEQSAPYPIINFGGGSTCTANPEGVFAHIFSGSTQVVSGGSWFYISGPFENDFIESFTLVSGATPGIKYNGTATNTFIINYSATISVSSNNKTIYFAVLKNGNLYHESDSIIYCKYAGEYYNGSGIVVVDLAPNDVISLVVKDDSTTETITYKNYVTSISRFFNECGKNGTNGTSGSSGTSGSGSSGTSGSGSSGTSGSGSSFSGTTDYLVKFDASGTGITNSLFKETYSGITIGNNALVSLYRRPQNVWIGTTTPAVLYSGNTSQQTKVVAIGDGALKSLTTGGEHIAIGVDALRNANTSYYNIGIGSNALKALTTGQANIAIGYDALPGSNGDSNVAIGWSSLWQNTTGSDNTAIGREALVSNRTNGGQTAVGRSALGSVGYNSGSGNTAVGYYAGEALLNASLNTIIGHNAGKTGQLTSAYNSIAIGANSFTNANNQTVIGNSQTTQTILKGVLQIGTLNASGLTTHLVVDSNNNVYKSTSGSGTSGTSGKSGTSGISGVDGSSGTSGEGTSGTSGVDGTFYGTSGTSGTDGTGGGGTSLTIPHLNIYMEGTSFTYTGLCYYDGTTEYGKGVSNLYARVIDVSQEFLDYNPKICLMRWTKRNRWNTQDINSNNVTYDYQHRWRHMVDGTAEIGLVGKNNVTDQYMKTEWDVPSGISSTQLIDIDFSDFIKEDGTSWLMGRKSRKRMQLDATQDNQYIAQNFGLCISIDNPDYINELVDYPKRIYGVVSPFRIGAYTFSNNNGFVGPCYFMKIMKL